ncbi:CARDB domain-containing protein [Halovivax cerinus]|uniref:CARDB domain-containing protein n=1 Tax=Halovivax cerinus TaxID=1487865 RepID=A0ABD5NK25_9EURY|nr:CARDB domain-containing protein [Halovivax cerinus]
MNRLLGSLAALAILSVLLAAPTAAVTLDDTDTTDTTSAVELDPTSSYASVEDGELALDFDRLNAAATTNVDDAFEITVHDASAERIWIAHQLPGVTFYLDGEPANEIDARRPLVVDPGESVTVGVSIDTHDAPTGTETFSVVVTTDETDAAAPTPGPLVVTNASVSTTNATVGEPVTVTATVTNPGTIPTTDTIDIAIDGMAVDDRRVRLSPGGERTVEFSWTPQDAGVYGVSVGNASAGTVAVSDATGPSFESIDLSSPLTAAVAPPAGLSLLVLGRAVRGRRR